MSRPIDHPVYLLLLTVGLALSLLRLREWGRTDERVTTIYLVALISAFAGAHVAYALCEDVDGSVFTRLVSPGGKSILGALLGGYIGVVMIKRSLDYKPSTGDFFASFVPLALAIGRIGCLFSGCCLGIVVAEGPLALHDSVGSPRFPAVPLEIAFNLTAVIVLLELRKRKLFDGRRFDLYLFCYGVFRFLTEFFRATPRWEGSVFSKYQVLALALAAWALYQLILKRTAVRCASLITAEAA